MTCFECGAEIGTARGCRRSGAPVPEPPQDDAPVPGPAAQEAAKSPKVLLAWIGVVLLNLLGHQHSCDVTTLAVELDDAEPGVVRRTTSTPVRKHQSR